MSKDRGKSVLVSQAEVAATRKSPEELEAELQLMLQKEQAKNDALRLRILRLEMFLTSRLVASMDPSKKD